MGPGGSPGLVLDRCRVRRGSTGVLKQKACKMFQLDIFGLPRALGAGGRTGGITVPPVPQFN